MRVSSDIDRCIEALEDNWDHADSSATVHKIPHPQMLRWCKNDLLEVALPEYKELYRRQDVPDLYRVNGLAYAVKRDYLLEKGRVMASDCVPVVVPLYRSFDLDLPDDTKVIERLLYV